MNSDKNKVAAFYVKERIICSDCMTDKDWRPLNQGKVITRQKAEENDKIFFCDICEEAIKQRALDREALTGDSAEVFEKRKCGV